MTPQEQERKLSQNIIDSLCHITDRPDGWLPHIVFVEEEGEDGYPCYVRYNLIDYHADGTCTLQRPNTDVRETDRELWEINIDWLITVWNRYKELCAEQNLPSKEYALPPFRNGDFVRLTDDVIAEVRRMFGDAPADYRRNMLLQVNTCGKTIRTLHGTSVYRIFTKTMCRSLQIIFSVPQRRMTYFPSPVKSSFMLSSGIVAIWIATFPMHNCSKHGETDLLAALQTKTTKPNTKSNA